jgi:replicative DNA helicase
MHHVNVQSSTHQSQFLNKIGSAGEREKIVPRLLELLNQPIANPNTDTIPKEAWELFVKPAKNHAKLTWRKICSELNTSYCGTTLFKSDLSRTRMHKLFKICGDQKLRDLATSDIYWDEIVSIKQLQMEDVYDATVEGVHNFVANDIIVHNSIEQDADIVMFLFRPEYYNPSHKPGVAEIIVAKNRHGKVGNVNLTYRKSIAQFQNYTPVSQDSQPIANEESFSAFSPN